VSALGCGRRCRHCRRDRAVPDTAGPPHRLTEAAGARRNTFQVSHEHRLDGQASLRLSCTRSHSQERLPVVSQLYVIAARYQNKPANFCKFGKRCVVAVYCLNRRHVTSATVKFEWELVSDKSGVAEALCYNQKVTRSRPDQVNTFSIYLILPAALGPEIHSASNRNEYQQQKSNVSGE
jgi:hypothetical protein